MDHSEAVANKANEKYFLGELSGDEREAFEEHFFECAECAAEVTATALLLDNAREVLRSAPATHRQEWIGRGFLGWFRPAYALAAVALLVATVGYQNLVTIPHLRNESTAQALPSFSLVTAGSRGAGGVEITVPRKTPFGLYVDIPADPSFTSYSAEVEKNGAKKFSIPVSAEQAKDTVQLFIPGLDAGQYELVIRGHKAGSETNAGQEIIRHLFVLRTK